MRPNEREHLYTDDVDYARTPDTSVWGSEDHATVELLERTEIHGAWMNLCAGDGRFNNVLAAKADRVVAADADESALQKLMRITPDVLKPKISTEEMNVTRRFPFTDASFDGIFCVGTLHLFPKEVFLDIVNEMDRVLKSDGRVILDFATDIKREYHDGSLWVVDGEPLWKLDDALAFLRDVFKEYDVHITTSRVEPETVQLGDKKYVFTSNFILLEAVKRAV